MFLKKKIYFNFITYIIFVILFIIGFLTYKDYGIGIDDKFHRLNGFFWLDYLLSFSNFEVLKAEVKANLNNIKDFTLPSIKYYNNYSIIFDVPAAFLELIFQKENAKDFYEFKHLLNFCVFYTGCLFFYRILRKRFNEAVSLLGICIFILSPRIYGESFYNMKDIIFLTFMTISYYYCLKTFENINYKNLFFLSLFSAICIQIRIIGVAIPLSFLVFYLLTILAKRKEFKNIYKIIFFLFTTIFLTYILWPYLWLEPIENFFKSFKNIIPSLYIFFEGNYYNNNFLPISYLPIWILISTPVLHLTLFFIGFFFILKRIFQRLLEIKENSITNDLWRGAKEKFDVFITLNFLVLFGLMVLLNIRLFNSWKHLYFLNFYFVYISTYFCYLFFIGKFSNIIKNFAFFSFMILSFLIIFRMTIYHPYQGLYFNFLISDNYKNKFEVDFTSLSARHFFDKIFEIEKNKELITIATASWTPLYRTLEIYSKDQKSRVKLVGQEYKKAKYIYTNNISEVDKNINDKYNIPSDFNKFYDLIIDGVIIYSIYKRSKN